MDNKKVENKKQMSNKKKFWVGMSALAAVGVITATVAYFTTSHEFNNSYKNGGYSVEVRDIINEQEADKMYPGQTINTDVTVDNTGATPLLTRISYIDMENPDSNGKGIELSQYPTATTLLKLTAGGNGSNKFVYNSTDGCYYYQGVLTNTTDPVQHLDSVTYQGNAISGTDAEYVTDYKTAKDADTWGDGEGLDYTFGTRNTANFNSVERQYIFQAKVETVQATDENGDLLTDGDLASKTADELKGYWTNMGV